VDDGLSPFSSDDKMSNEMLVSIKACHSFLVPTFRKRMPLNHLCWRIYFGQLKDCLSRPGGTGRKRKARHLGTYKWATDSPHSLLMTKCQMKYWCPLRLAIVSWFWLSMEHMSRCVLFHPYCPDEIQGNLISDSL